MPGDAHPAGKFQQWFEARLGKLNHFYPFGGNASTDRRRCLPVAGYWLRVKPKSGSSMSWRSSAAIRAQAFRADAPRRDP
jgi:hypothetical protein